MKSNLREHWTKVYEEKSASAFSWHQAEPEPSLRALDRYGAKSSSAIIDIGGGASKLVDALLRKGWEDVTQRDAYRRALLAGTAAGGLLIMATFALDGPDKCSGLPVQRYDPQSLAAELGHSLQLLDGWGEAHVTPWGSSQSFNWCAFRRTT